jgi:hypothetical protein
MIELLWATAARKRQLTADDTGKKLNVLVSEPFPGNQHRGYGCTHSTALHTRAANYRCSRRPDEAMAGPPLTALVSYPLVLRGSLPYVLRSRI